METKVRNGNSSLDQHQLFMNKYDTLLDSFTNVCDYLIAQAETRNSTVRNDTNDVCMKTRKVIDKISDTVTNITECCNTITLSKDNLDHKFSNPESESIQLPYEMHQDTVESLRTVFNLTLPDKNDIRVTLESSMEAASRIEKLVNANIDVLNRYQDLQQMPLNLLQS